MRLWRCILGIVALCLLAGCASADCPPVAGPDLSIYERCMARGEYVKSATQIGPFTVLDVDYSSGHGSLGYRDRFERLLHRGRVVLKNARRIHRWEDRDDVVLLVDYHNPAKPNDGMLHLVYEQAGRPVVEHIPQTGYYANETHPYGLPLTSQLRYFSNGESRDDAGFLLQAPPARRTVLPPGLEGHRSPTAQQLAGIAPDAKSFAYTDRFSDPTVLLVVDADGTLRDPIPIPIPPQVPGGRELAHPFKPLWKWFDETFTWQRDARGHWYLVPAWQRSPAGAAAPLEAFFVDAASAYRDCIGEDTPGCLGGWRLRKDPDNQEQCCAARYSYLPSTPARAFGAPVLELAIGKTASWGAGYNLLLDAPMAQVLALLEQRFAAQGGKALRLDTCVVTQGRETCQKKLTTLTHMDRLDGYSYAPQILSSAERQPVFVTPSATFALYPETAGRTWLLTLVRHPPPRAAAAAGQSTP